MWWHNHLTPELPGISTLRHHCSYLWSAVHCSWCRCLQGLSFDYSSFCISVLQVFTSWLPMWKVREFKSDGKMCFCMVCYQVWCDGYKVSTRNNTFFFCPSLPHCFWCFFVSMTFDSRWLVIASCLTGMERSTATSSECAFSSRLPPRTEDCSVPVVILWCDLTIYCTLSSHPLLDADLSPCTGCYKLILLTLYSGPAPAVW